MRMTMHEMRAHAQMCALQHYLQEWNWTDSWEETLQKLRDKHDDITVNEPFCEYNETWLATNVADFAEWLYAQFRDVAFGFGTKAQGKK